MNIAPIICIMYTKLKTFFFTPKNYFLRKGLKIWKISCKDEWKLISEDMNKGQQWNINYIILTYRNIIPKGTSALDNTVLPLSSCLSNILTYCLFFPQKTSLVKSILNWILDANLNFSHPYNFATWCW